MPNARVLPVPVRAWPIMSVPVSAIGMAMAWIGNGLVMPTCSRASTIELSTPSSLNDVGWCAESPASGVGVSGSGVCSEPSMVSASLRVSP